MLSRIDNTSVLLISQEGDWKVRIRKLQAQDTFCKKIVSDLDSVEGQDSSYVMIEDILYREDIRQEESKLRLVVPVAIVHEILEAYHDNVMAGHLGRRKTYLKIAERYYWPRMYTDVENYVLECPMCNKIKARRDKLAGDSRVTPATEPWETIGIDFLGPIKMTKRGNRYVLVVTDHFTKWVEVIATPTCEASEVVNILLDQIIARYGAPKRILSDQGSSFLNQALQILTKRIGMEHAFTTAYRPQTNGITERFNKTLAGMIAMYVTDQQDDWDLYLQQVVGAYRTAIHATTDQSPYKMLFGREPRLIADFDVQLKQTNEMVGDEKLTDTAQYTQKLLKKIIEIHEQVRERQQKLIQKAEREKVPHDDQEYQPGQMVWLWAPRKEIKKGDVKKFAPRWHGPYRIIEKKTHNRYQVADAQGLPFREDIHISNLRLYKRGPRPVAIPIVRREQIEEDQQEVKIDQPAQEARIAKKRKRIEKPKDSDEGREWEVEEIRARITQKTPEGDRYKYLVKWRGYVEPTWEVEENLTNCRATLDAFRTGRRWTCGQCTFIASRPELVVLHQERCSKLQRRKRKNHDV